VKKKAAIDNMINKLRDEIAADLDLNDFRFQQGFDVFPCWKY
jgi:hypothetical protein